jgi:hypothetical protein
MALEEAYSVSHPGALNPLQAGLHRARSTRGQGRPADDFLHYRWAGRRFQHGDGQLVVA